MKKLFAIAAATCCALALSATTYTCHLKVVINGEATEQEQVQVEVIENNGKYDLSLKNFVLWMGDFPMPVGNIAVSGVTGTDEFGYTTIHYKDDLTITEGDDPQFDTWAGPLLGAVPTDLTARFTDTAASADIEIDMMQMLGQVISVSIFGVAPAEEGLKGDVNNDGEINISDVNTVIDIVLAN